MDRTGTRTGGAPLVLMYLLGAAAVVGATLAVGVREARTAQQLADQQSEARALEVARTAAAAINVGVENAVLQLDRVVGATGVAELEAGDPGAQEVCQQKLAALLVQQFSFLLLDGDGGTVCFLGTTEESDATAAAGRDSVTEWLASGAGFEQLGVVDEPLVDGRMTFSPNGQTGLATVAVPAGEKVAVAWQDTWRAFTPPLDSAMAAPGIDAAAVVDDRGRVVVPVPALVDGQPLTARARAFDDGTVLVPPREPTEAYRQLEDVRAGGSSGIQASNVPTGGRASGASGTRWVSVPVPRLDGSVVVAWDPAAARADADVVRSEVAGALVALAVVAVVVLAVVWLVASRPVARLARQVRNAGGGPVSGPVSGAREVRELRDAFDEGSRSWLGVAEVAGAARERERERLSGLLNAEVAQRLAAGALLVDEDPERAKAELRAAGSRLGDIAAGLGTETVVAGGLAAALGSYTNGAGDRVVFEDRGSVARTGADAERIVYRSVLEVLAAAEVNGCLATVVVEDVDAVPQVTVTVTGGGRCPGVDDPNYWKGHELTAVGGTATVSAGCRDGERRVLLVPPRR